VHLLPQLTRASTGPSGTIASARSAVGFDVVGRRLVYRDSAGRVAAYDLIANRERTIAPSGALASLGADGTLLAVGRTGTVVESQPWGTRQWPGSLGGGLREAFAAPGARLIAVRRGTTDTLAVATRESGLSVAVAAPAASDRSASRDGDAVAFATDSGLVVIEERESDRPWFVPLAAPARAVVFSPSGHRLYVALDNREEIAIIDRFNRAPRATVTLPAPAGALRADPWGRVLLARAAEGDETWVISIARERVLGRLSGGWSSDLPFVSRDGVLLSREGRAVVAREVRSLDSLGAVAGGAGDLWLVGQWSPPRPTAAARAEARLSDTLRGRERDAERRESTLWVQVSVSQNEAWARSLAEELRAGGRPVVVAGPRNPGDGYRVLVGPYRSRDAADSAGRSLGRPYWIVERSQGTDREP
jgi:hypothetical protein